MFVCVGMRACEQSGTKEESGFPPLKCSLWMGQVYLNGPWHLALEVLGITPSMQKGFMVPKLPGGYKPRGQRRLSS